MVYLAHTENERGVAHQLKDHLRGVGELASEFAARMNTAMGDAGRWAGLLHDLGKYRDEFQAYLRAERDSSIETHHAVYGAALAFQRQRRWLGPALTIAGHHAGLHNWADLQNDLRADAKYHANDQLSSIVVKFEAEVLTVAKEIDEPDFVKSSRLSAELYVRLLFSAVVDADFLDTESHHLSATRLIHQLQSRELLHCLVAEKEAKPGGGELNDLRNRIFQQCIDAAHHKPGFFSLTVPTGGGKTLSAMAFALSHAMRHNLLNH
jgi:CRISPR-associated endonuclease/helicase Cas3